MDAAHTGHGIRRGAGKGLVIDAAALEAEFAALPDAGLNLKPWTVSEDELLVRFWPVKRHVDVARLLGRGEHVCRRRYAELTA